MLVILMTKCYQNTYLSACIVYPESVGLNLNVTSLHPRLPQPGKKRYTYYVYILCILLVQAMYVFGVQIRNTVLVQVGCMLRARNM